ncbi:conserved hypothetical protein [Ferroglobus placidus DSM 10642]|uniref:Uncharacterized protein n=1 Tax=Ferroglobus placidus (strain DSM 10642 / AEDII12DO) TaxID=589924 RepID=D3RYW3_FERPA|nr:hypothetical protein [Ferroglobus placidus]ADC65676.1 conserved hypothetical protein [Ferroglobus placidus DSM 10642]
MSEKDILIERLERKLAEKEREIRSLKQVVGMSYENFKEEILSEVNERLKEFEAKIVELSKTVRTLMDEVLYLKAEISPKKEEVAKKVVEREEEKKEEKSDIIVCD